MAGIILLAACERPTDISKEALLEKTRHWKEAKVATWSYTGAADGHDYFYFHDLGVSQFYRVRSGEIDLSRTFPRTRDRSRWLIMPWGPRAVVR